MAGDACLDELVDDIAAIAEGELTTESLAVDLCREEALPPGQVAGFAARALGKMTREQCSRLGGNDANIRAATDHLFGWVQTGTRGMHTTAAEQLLIFQPAAAAALKRQLLGERASLLEPIESRKTEPFVEDSGPEPHSPATRARALECDPEEDHAPICEAPFSYDRGRGGDVFIQEAIAFNASFLDGEDCSALAARYDREIDLENGTWDDGFGINDPCNATKPFARTVNPFGSLRTLPTITRRATTPVE